MDTAKPTRAYRSTLRERQAQETRERVIRAAADAFSAQGFQATTMSAIARAAGVSTETVKATASKSELLVAAFEVTFAGSEGQSTLADSSIGRGALDTDGPGLVDAVLEIIAAANERGHALWTVLLGAALSDPGVDAALQDMLARRHADFRRLVDAVAAAGTPVEDPAGAAAELSFLFSPEGYQQLVVQSGWPRDRYLSWMRTALDRTLAAPVTA